MSVLSRFKDTDKYPRKLREKFATFIGLADERALLNTFGITGNKKMQVVRKQLPSK